MAGIFSRPIGWVASKLAGGSPFNEIGVGGTPIYGGYPGGDITRPQLQGLMKWRKASELLADVSIIAASVRYFLNLTSNPTWKAKPPSDKQEAKDVAEFVESVIYGCDISWARMVRRQAIYRFHGFGIHEWVAKNRDDGKIGLASIEPRPVQTIARWEVDKNSTPTGVFQRAPQNGVEIYLPREKFLYFRDDMLTDHPEGMGWFRHLLDPAEALKTYMQLEKVGFQRDLSGIPIGRAPLTAINAKIGTKVMGPDGVEIMFTKAMADDMVKGLKEFVSVRMKQPDTGLMLDSQPFTGVTDTGKQVSTVLQWGLDLLTGKSDSIDHLGKAIRRLQFDMSLIMGTENLLVGREGEGSRALSEDKSRNLYMNVNSTTGEMAETADRDIVGVICTLNGIPDELRPKLEVEDASFKDVQQVAQVLMNMGTAGAVLAPDDPAINDVRDLMGISHAPEMTPEMMGMLTGGGGAPGGGPKPGDPARGTGQGGTTNDPSSTQNNPGK